MRGLGHARSLIFIRFTPGLQRRRVFRQFRKSTENYTKINAKMAAKLIQNQAWTRFGARFLRF